MKTTLTRRDMLINTAKGTLAVVATASISPLFLSGCKKNNAKDTPEPLAKSVTLCPDQENLSEQDQNIRASLKYVDESPIAQRTCDNCKLYTFPDQKAPCGGCKILPGPIHPKGYCTAWIYRM